MSLAIVAGRTITTDAICPYRLAELIALDYSIDEQDEFAGCAVNVCSADGHELFSVPVQLSWRVAA